MANKNKKAGTAWETLLCEYAREHGYPYAERRAQGGKNDRGDIAGIPGVVIEGAEAGDQLLHAIRGLLEDDDIGAEA